MLAALPKNLISSVSNGGQQSYKLRRTRAGFVLKSEEHTLNDVLKTIIISAEANQMTICSILDDDSNKLKRNEELE